MCVIPVSKYCRLFVVFKLKLRRKGFKLIFLHIVRVYPYKKKALILTLNTLLYPGVTYAVIPVQSVTSVHKKLKERSPGAFLKNSLHEESCS